MDTKKRAGLIIAVLLIAGVIWYLNSTKAEHGTSQGTLPSVVAVATSTLTGTSTTTTRVNQALQQIIAADKASGAQRAIEIAGPTGFVNTAPFKLADIVGKKVILLDFWTYSCINCIRTLPYLTAWYQKYKDQGLVIVGMHTPEFEFEKNIANVQTAAKKYGITYPVVLDSNYGTWNAYNNLYWPHEYLIDIGGYIVHDHIGEGDYATTESKIKELLAERASVVGTGNAPMPEGTVSVPTQDLSGVGSPETYFGAARNMYLANGRPLVNGTQMLNAPANILLNHLYLSGTWNFEDEFAANSDTDAKIFYRYKSAKVFFVASAPSGATIEVLQDGKPVGTAAGSDVVNDTLTVGASRLYSVIANPDGAGEHTLELIIHSPGLQAYTFTFG